MSAVAQSHGSPTSAAVSAALRTRARRPDLRTVIIALICANIVTLAQTQVLTLTASFAIVGALLLTVLRARTVVLLVGIDLVLAAAVLTTPLIGNEAVGAAVGVTAFWFLRMAPAAAMGGYALATIRPTELLAGLRNWRVPAFITVPAAVVFRVLPVIGA